jgi:N6-L-threonylcarbamoyladenine synthase
MNNKQHQVSIIKHQKKINREGEPVILAIDTSCDDTSVAVLQGRRVLSSIISSQIELHKKWGGVVPDIARRAHKENIEGVYKEALKRAGLKIEDIEYIAVTYGPGLAIALEVGLDFAKDLAIKHNKKFVKVNHMEGHMLASFILNKNSNGDIPEGEDDNVFPALALLVSGNHTEIILMKNFGEYEIIGETLDDAAGEAFDKVARMLNIGYPGGPVVTLLAGRASDQWSDIRAGFNERQGKKSLAEIAGRFGLTVPMMRSDDLNFSFSGLKTACLYKIEELRKRYSKDVEWSYDFSREFISAISRSLTVKLDKAMTKYPEVKSVFIGGGVSNNKYIVRDVGILARKRGKKYHIPEMRFRSDNGGMIGIAAFYNITRQKSWIEGDSIATIERKPMLTL